MSSGSLDVATLANIKAHLTLVFSRNGTFITPLRLLHLQSFTFPASTRLWRLRVVRHPPPRPTAATPTTAPHSRNNIFAQPPIPGPIPFYASVIVERDWTWIHRGKDSSTFQAYVFPSGLAFLTPEVFTTRSRMER
jgi:hypothetical protein